MGEHQTNINIKDMVNSYITLIDADSNIINSEVYNVGFENHSVNELASQIKLLVKDNVELIYERPMITGLITYLQIKLKIN